MKIFTNIFKLYEIVRIYKFSALLLLSIMLISAITETLSMGIIMPFLEVIVGDAANSSGYTRFLSPILKHFSPHQHLFVIGALLVALILIKNIFYIANIWYSSKFVFRLRQFWTERIMQKYMHASYRFLMSQRQGLLLNNLINEPNLAAKSLKQIIDFTSKIILTIALYGMLLFVNWQITISMTFSVVVVIFIFSKISYNYSIGVGRERLIKTQDITSIGAEHINAIRQIKVFSLEDRICKKFSKTLHSMLKMMLNFTVVNNLPRAVAEVLVITGFVSILLFLQYGANKPLVEMIPTIALFAVISQRFTSVMSMLYTQRMTIFSCIPSLKLVHRLCQTEIEQELIDKGDIVKSLKSDIIFNNVSFSYENKKVIFDNLSLNIPNGKITAIVGSSGVGKTTIADLVLGFFKKDEGDILINGIDIDNINLSSWRKLTGYITQDVFLFNASIKENILIGKPNASDEEIIKAAKNANADIFIKNMTSGYDTIIGERGLKISGGQRQRIAIARAAISNPDLLILDEATSALDAESENLIQKSIEEFSKKMTIIIIAHRLSTVKKADNIIVLDKGRVVESGTHDELMKKESFYYKLASASFIN